MIYLFYGEDSFRLRQELKNLCAKVPAPQELELSQESDDSSLRVQTQELWEGQGLFSPQKLVILRNFVNQIHKYPKTEAYLEKALPETHAKITVVFVQTESPDKRLRFFKKLQAVAKTLEFETPTGKALETWIKSRLRDEGSKIENAALAELQNRLGEGYTLWQVENELRKLLLFSITHKLITAEMVRQAVARNINQNIFDLTNLVAEGKIAAAIRLLEEMVSTAGTGGSKPQIIQIVGALAAQLRSLLMVKELEGRSPQEIAKILGWIAGRVWINSKLAKKYERQKLIQLLEDLKAIDFRLKTSEEPPKLLLSLFFQKAGAAK